MKKSHNTKPVPNMKTKLTCLLIAIGVASTATLVQAGPDLQTMELRKQAAAPQTYSRVADRGPVKYLANPSGKGGTVATTDAPVTSIALFKSKKSEHCDVCIKR